MAVYVDNTLMQLLREKLRGKASVLEVQVYLEGVRPEVAEYTLTAFTVVEGFRTTMARKLVAAYAGCTSGKMDNFLLQMCTDCNMEPTK